MVYKHNLNNREIGCSYFPFIFSGVFPLSFLGHFIPFLFAQPEETPLPSGLPLQGSAEASEIQLYKFFATI